MIHDSRVEDYDYEAAALTDSWPGECFPCEKCEPLESCLGLVLYPRMRKFLQKEAASTTGCQGTDGNIVNDQSNKNHLPMTREKQLEIATDGDQGGIIAVRASHTL